jgi:hypothetical protein
MDEDAPLKVTHDVSQTLQRKIEGNLAEKIDIHRNTKLTNCLGLEDVERAFVHVDYENEHDPHEEHKPVHDKRQPKRSLKQVMKDAKKRISAVMPSR